MDAPLPGLVRLVNELELRLTGTAPGPGLPPSHADAVPPSATYVVVLFDGLGSHQLAHRAAGDLRRSHAGDLQAPFPTTTTVALATIATGLDPGGHGTIAHLMWIPEVARVVNTLKWVTPTGERVDVDTSGFLPAPNLWERLSATGCEPITVQPVSFEGTPLSRALYRGCRFEGVRDEDELIEATVSLARVPGRLILTYLPHVDVAAHVSGQQSPEYARALKIADDVWSGIRHRLAPGAGLVGSSDHGHIDYSPDDKLLIRDPAYAGLVFHGDSRALMVRGDRSLIERLASDAGAMLIRDGELRRLFEPATHPQIDERLPDAVLLAPDRRLLIPPGFDKRLVGYHGGLDPREATIPLLVG